MKLLVTAGNTRVPIDKVRVIDNIFHGRTGTEIAHYFADKGVDTFLLTSSPHLSVPRENLHVMTYQTYDELLLTMRDLITLCHDFDAIIHSAAVSDYKVEGLYIGELYPDNDSHVYEMSKIDTSQKVSSDHSELWMKMVPTEKIVDLIKSAWGFKGQLVKFKLQVGMSDEELINIAIESMLHSRADIIVANTLEGMTKKAFIVRANYNSPMEVNRTDLPNKLFEVMQI